MASAKTTSRRQDVAERRPVMEQTMMKRSRSTRVLDVLVLLASLAIIALSVMLMVRGGTFVIPLSEDERLSWHLVRSTGVVAYVMLLCSTVWGLVISAQFVRDWSPGPVSLTMHSTLSWLAVALALAHALLLLFDRFYTYTLADLFVPFIGPYRPEAVGLGTLAFWVLLVVSLSFPLRKRMGHARWKLLHYASYAAFGMVSLHGLLAGTEGEALGFRVLIGGGLAAVLALTSMRVSRARAKVAAA